MTARSEAHLDVLLTQEVVRAHDIVDAFNLMIDVLNSGPRRGKQCHSVMHGIDAQKWSLADPIADACITKCGPEFLILARRNGMQSDMGKAGDAGIAGREVAAAAMSRPNDEFDGIAAGICKHDGRSHPALLAFAACRRFDDVPGIVQFRPGSIE